MAMLIAKLKETRNLGQLVELLFVALLRAAGDALLCLDRLLFPVSDWEWVGKGDVLYRRSVSRNGFQFIAELSADRRTVPEFLGRFDDVERPGAIAAGGGTFFLPAKTELEHFEELLAAKVDEAKARDLARRRVIEDMQRAASYGSGWMLYTLAVSAKRGSRILSEVSLWGIEADPSVSKMDPYVDELFEAMIPEAEKEALLELRNMCTALRAHC